VSESSTILVVDDQPINVRLLQRKLVKEGFTVDTAFSGQECLEQFEKRIPDLVLLDVMMPEMSGLEVCTTIKANPSWKDTAIIFITAKTSKEGKLEGLKAGAADYITKPIDLEETLARVKTQLRIRDSHRQNLDLQARLAETRQHAAVGAITQGIAHNLNNLLGVVVGYLDLLRNASENPKMVQRAGNLIDQAVKRMVEIVRQLTTIASSEEISHSPVPLNRLVESSIERCAKEYQKRLQVKVDLPETNIIIDTNQETFEDVLGRVLINACESYPEQTPEDQRPIHLSGEIYSEMDERWLRLRVRDHGTGLHPSVAQHIFEPFISIHTAVGRGMGLTIARHGAQALNGELEVSNHPEGGVEAVITQPLKPAETPAIIRD
jgi:two-component system, sensor histidine kinase and response regulator